jgi:hypothetical protein
MYSGLLPAGDHREMTIWMLPAVGGGEARLCGMVNVREVLINPVTEEELKLLFKALAKRRAIRRGSSTWYCVASYTNPRDATVGCHSCT